MRIYNLQVQWMFVLQGDCTGIVPDTSPSVLANTLIHFKSICIKRKGPKVKAN